MKFTDWEPTYEPILADFGFDRAADEAVRDRAAVFAKPFDLDRLDCAGASVAVAGAGPSLESTSDLELARGAAPVDAVANYGGFTDGDRAAFLADHCGADRLVFPGWDFDDPDVDGMKARKLDWAERLLRLLERRRGERFDVLDGRRGWIDPL